MGAASRKDVVVIVDPREEKPQKKSVYQGFGTWPGERARSE
jgi:hypothetical protein